MATNVNGVPEGFRIIGKETTGVPDGFRIVNQESTKIPDGFRIIQDSEQRYPDDSTVGNLMKRMKEDGRSQPNFIEMALSGISGAGEGARNILGQFARGLSLGASDKIDKEKGVGRYIASVISTENIPEITKDSALAKTASIGTELTGSALTGKNIMGALKSGGVPSKYIVPVASAIEGGAYGGFTGGSVAGGALIGLAAGKAGEMAAKGLSAGIGKLSDVLKRARLSKPEKAMIYIRSQIGDDAFKELMEKSRQTGRSLIEVADDETLQLAEKAIVSSGGARSVLTKTANQLSDEAGDGARRVINETLGKGTFHKNLEAINKEYTKRATPLYEKALSKNVPMNKKTLPIFQDEVISDAINKVGPQYGIHKGTPANSMMR